MGGNGLLQAGGAGIAASAPDAHAVARRDPGCCVAEYLDQPVAPYTVDLPLDDAEILRLGDVDWQVDGPEAATTAVASLHRLADRAPRVLLPAHGAIPADPGAALATGVRRAQHLVDDPAGAVWYGARRILAFALMIRDGMPTGDVEPYLHARVWLQDAARLLDRTAEDLAVELVDTMVRSGAVVLRDGRLHAAAEHTPVTTDSLRVPLPRAWPAPHDEPPPTTYPDGSTIFQ